MAQPAVWTVFVNCAHWRGSTLAIYKTVLIIFPLNLQTITITLDVVKWRWGGLQAQGSVDSLNMTVTQSLCNLVCNVQQCQCHMIYDNIGHASLAQLCSHTIVHLPVWLRVTFGRRSFAGLLSVTCAWSTVKRWPLCGLTVRCGSKNWANLWQRHVYTAPATFVR